MYSEEQQEDPLYTKLSKILELTSMIFGHYKDTGQKERAHSLISLGSFSYTSSCRKETKVVYS